MQQFQAGNFSFEQWLQYQEWLHAEDVCDPQTKADMGVDLETDRHDRFAAAKHNNLSVTPEYL
eukprot:11912139-Karenia_brevis.AAC.1